MTTAPPRPVQPPPTLTVEQREQIKRARQAERHVWQVYSAPVARVLAVEVQAFIDFGHRFDTAGRVAQELIDDILARPVPERVS